MSADQDDQAQAQLYQPEFLPDLQNIQAWSEGLAQQAQRLHNSGQRIVSDFRTQWQSLVDEAAQMEADRVEAIHQLNAAHQTKLARNERMRQQVESMIDFYTGHVAQRQAVNVEPNAGQVVVIPAKQVKKVQPRQKFLGVF